MGPIQGVLAVREMMSASAPTSAPGGVKSTGREEFGAVLRDMLAADVKANAAAGRAVEQLATGQAADLHTVGLAVAQADLQFRLILEVRNRLTEAYQEVMRMQV